MNWWKSLRQRFCWHIWVKARHQFQALGDVGYSTTYFCRKCDKCLVVNCGDRHPKRID